ncbi:3-isopropylmalate dehydrogenase [Candidatus Gastranaerophilus sp. (ex Termes propinquus)]|nr:3-isopropylmalate dehydrogenase [Candidatus Gastranaerophilus sp. (ex Termes propinquus)]
MTTYKIAVLEGDGIGPEVIAEAKKVLSSVEKVFDISFEYESALIGGCAYDATGVPLPDATVNLAKASDAVLLGAVGDWKYDTLPPEVRPEKALLGIRKELNLFANLRPAIVWDELVDSSPLKPEIVSGTDIMIIRELTGDVYFGEPKGIESRAGQRVGFNNMVYKEDEIRRIAHIAFETAMARNKKLCSVDKANVLDVSRLWREVVVEVSKDYPEVELSHMYVDNAAMQIIRAPKQFDTIVTGNIFGDILSDEASMLSGSLGLLPSASLSEGANAKALYEPIHGSAPDLRGKDTVNPIATILSAGMMMKYSFKNDEAYNLIEKAIKQVLKKGYRTQDIMSKNMELVGCQRMGSLVAESILNI